jgi:hypothetical protein
MYQMGFSLLQAWMGLNRGSDLKKTTHISAIFFAAMAIPSPQHGKREL